MNLKSLSLKNRLTMMILASSGIVILLISAIFVINEAISIKRFVRHNISAIAGITALNVTAALSFKDPATAKELLMAVKTEPHIIAAAIYDKNGNVFADYLRAEAAAALPKKIDIKSILEEAKLQGNDFSSAYEIKSISNDYLDMIRPVTLNGKIIGLVFIRADQRWIYGHIKLFAVVVFGIMIVLIGISYIISSRLMRIISVPIENLASTMRYVKNHQDYSVRAMASCGVEELETLMDGFNNMLEQIQDRDKKLKMHKEQLERQVTLRTEALKLSEAQKKKLLIQQKIQQAYTELVTQMNSIDVDEMLSKCLDHISQVADMVWGGVYLWDEKKKEINIRKMFFLNSFFETWKDEKSSIIEDFNKRSRKIALLAFKTGKRESEDWEQKSEDGLSTIFKVYAFPLSFQEKRIGVLVLAANKSPDEYTMTFLNNATSQLGVAVHNAIIFENLKEKSAQLKQSNIELQRASRMKSDFLANMSHELRTPLNAIIGFSELLLDEHFGEINEIQREYLSDILESGRHLLELINGILDLSKVEAGKMEFNLVHISVEEALKSSLTMVRHKAMKHNISLTIEVKKVPDTILADELKLKQILYNLVSNAVKFTEDGGKIVLSAEVVDKKWLLNNVPDIFKKKYKAFFKNDRDKFIKFSVDDTGIGIPEENLEKIFDAFEQVDSSRSKKYKGTGLGLALCKNFVELHGGIIWVKSKVGKGSSFNFVIPLDLSLI